MNTLYIVSNISRQALAGLKRLIGLLDYPYIIIYKNHGKMYQI